ncbi:hypothetical protein BVRB_3g048180 [Beta vulgaris subsp. vulgaris]|nr:hypothetical protein BVRB_3g048180 [Beta vulgaris subsp. vulgaris]
MVRLKQQQQQQQQQQQPYNINDVKSHIAIETCNIYHNSHFSCIHHNHNFLNKITIQSPFIDWYLILRVAEDASISTIKKQYHKLALLLHPDKNKHPKAEFAFKLISQAYNCLSDDAKRVSFNLDKWRNKCNECRKIPHNIYPTKNTNINTTNLPKSTRNSRFYKIQQHFRGIREKFIVEARVIEECIRVNQAPKNEYPVFDPSSYTHQGYPHRRNDLFYKKGASFWNVNVQNRNLVPNYDQRRGRCESPIFELRTNYGSLNVNSACVSS